MLTAAQKQFFDDNGFLVLPGMFNTDEVAGFTAHYMALRRSGTYPGDMVADTKLSRDPLKRYPRMINMHDWDEASMSWLLDRRLSGVLTELFGGEPLAVQTMIYFKPPGARGQALHQDNFYLKARPGTCMAAWLALDPADEANGCMRVVPGSHRWPILCAQKADTSVSFTDVTVPLPEGQDAVPVVMAAGDVLFFHGNLVHGSYPNTTGDRFRRSLIGHYVEGLTEKFSGRALRMDGTRVTLDPSEGGGPCGVWVDIDGTPVVEMAGVAPAGVSTVAG